MSTTTKRAFQAIIDDSQGIQRIIDDAVTAGSFTHTEALAKIAVEVSRIEGEAWRALNSHHEERNQ
jgi:hypothetical protein